TCRRDEADNVRGSRAITFSQSSSSIASSASLPITGYTCFLLYVRCETPERLCRAASDHPPWALISGVAAAPALTLLWHWRTTSRGREAVQRDQEIFSARFADGVRMLELGGLSAF